MKVAQNKAACWALLYSLHVIVRFALPTERVLNCHRARWGRYHPPRLKRVPSDRLDRVEGATWVDVHHSHRSAAASAGQLALSHDGEIGRAHAVVDHMLARVAHARAHATFASSGALELAKWFFCSLCCAVAVLHTLVEMPSMNGRQTAPPESHKQIVVLLTPAPVGV